MKWNKWDNEAQLGVLCLPQGCREKPVSQTSPFNFHSFIWTKEDGKSSWAHSLEFWNPSGGLSHSVVIISTRPLMLSVKQESAPQIANFALLSPFRKKKVARKIGTQNLYAKNLRNFVKTRPKVPGRYSSVRFGWWRHARIHGQAFLLFLLTQRVYIVSSFWLIETLNQKLTGN